MLTTGLDNCLDSFVKAKNESMALLIDGKWGCGKTFEVNKFLKDKRKESFVYLSLFGIDTSDEIVIRLSEYLDSTFIKNINGHYSFVSLIEPEPYNECLIVFDDLERKADSLNYSALFGIINSLKMLGFKIICIINSEETTQPDDYEEFKEKTFDDVFNVQADFAIFSDVAKSVSKLEFENSILKSVNGNWRIIKKAEMKYKNIIDEAKKRKVVSLFSLMGISNSDFFRCCCLAEMCYFSRNKNRPTLTNNDDRKTEYEVNCNLFNTSIANNLDQVFFVTKENNSFLYHVRLLLLLLSENDYDGFFANFKKKSSPVTAKNHKRPDAILDKNYFLLDDKGRQRFTRTFINRLGSLDFNNSSERQLLNNFIQNRTNDLSDKEANAIIHRVVDTIPSDKSEAFLNQIRRSGEQNSFSNKLRKALAISFENKKEKENDVKLSELVGKKKYKDLSDFLYGLRYSSIETKQSIILGLIKHDFCLPDLSRETSSIAWSYCHEVAKFVSETEYEKDFIEALKKQIDKHPHSKSLREKCEALVKYNLTTNMRFY